VKLFIDSIGCAFQDTKASREIIGKPRISLSTMEFLLLFLSNSNTSKPLSTLRYIIITFFLSALSSCTIALPEFQTAESLAPGAHKVAAGGFQAVD